MATKKTVKHDMPSECCGTCSRTITEDGVLFCYGMPAFVFKNDDDTLESYRGAEVEPNEPPCFAFSKRLNS